MQCVDASQFVAVATRNCVISELSLHHYITLCVYNGNDDMHIYKRIEFDAVLKMAVTINDVKLCHDRKVGGLQPIPLYKREEKEMRFVTTGQISKEF
jgi:hypothetical protein